MSEAPATTTTSPTAPPELREASNRLIWALVGGVFVLDAFLAGRLMGDDGMAGMVSALIGLLILLVPMLRIVLDDLRSGQLRMNELVVLAVLAGAARGDFKTAGIIAFIMLISLIIESRTASGARASLEALARLSPGLARRLNADGTEERIDPQQLRPGDTVRVRPGENVQADGEILRGTTSLQEATITGESLPVDKGAGATVFAGTVNLTGAIEFRVTPVGKDTTLGRVRELILTAEKTKLPVVRLIDQYVHYYTPVVLILALIVWFFTRDLDRIVALFVAACPIAVVLATPSAMVAALSAAARVGLLVKDLSDFELMARINAFVFDKTGTLTAGRLSVARLAPCTGVESSELLRQAASAEQQSNHPVALAVCALAKRVNVTLTAPDNVHEEPGRGIRAVFADGEVRVGNMAWMTAAGADAAVFPGVADDEVAGMSLLFVMRDGQPLGWIGFQDEPRAKAKACIRQLRDRRVPRLALITGDRKEVARKVASELGLDEWRGECVPSDKVDYVEAVKKDGYQVAFVGDGVNDGPALAASHVGIALGAAGSDVAIGSASIALMNNELDRLPFLVDLARTARRVIVENFCVGGLLIAAGMGLSAACMLSPVLAAVLQACGAVGVVLNSARLVREGETLQTEAR